MITPDYSVDYAGENVANERRWDHRADDDVSWRLRMPVPANDRITQLAGEWFQDPELSLPEWARLANTLRRVIAIGLTAIDKAQIQQEEV